jgi:F-type H+-transporting ATPase subunit b
MLTFPPDISFVVQIISFVVLWFGLKRLLFDPTIHVLEERERRTVGEQQAAAGLRKDAERSAEDYERRMQALRATLATDAEAAFKDVEAAANAIVAQAREQTGTELMQLRDALARQARDARPGLASEADALGAQMLERVLGRPAI